MLVIMCHLISIVGLSMTDILEAASDKDISPEAPLEFPTSYSQSGVVSVDLDHAYVLHLAASSDGSLLGATLSDGSVSVYTADTLVKKCTMVGAAQEALSGIRFSPTAPALMYTCASEGEVKLWDLREEGKTMKPARIFSSKPGNLI